MFEMLSYFSLPNPSLLQNANHIANQDNPKAFNRALHRFFEAYQVFKT
jgi:hypothetical protein